MAMGMIQGKPNQPTTPYIVTPPPHTHTHIQDLAIEITRLVNRYVTILPRKKPKHVLPHQPTPKPKPLPYKPPNHHILPHPLICPLFLNKYNLPLTRDVIFGFHGDTLSSKWEGEGYAHPTDHHTIMEAIH